MEKDKNLPLFKLIKGNRKHILICNKILRIPIKADFDFIYNRFYLFFPCELLAVSTRCWKAFKLGILSKTQLTSMRNVYWKKLCRTSVNTLTAERKSASKVTPSVNSEIEFLTVLVKILPLITVLKESFSLQPRNLPLWHAYVSTKERRHLLIDHVKFWSVHISHYKIQTVKINS